MMKKASFIIILLFASLIRASYTPTELAEADSIPLSYFNWFVAATGYWPLFYKKAPKPPTWVGYQGGSLIDPNSMRKNLHEQGFDTTRSDLSHYKAFLDTLFPVDYSIIPDTTELDSVGLTFFLVLKDDPPEVIWGTIYRFYKLEFNEKGKIIALTDDIRDSGSEGHYKWDNRGNSIYYDYYNGPSGGNVILEREYDESNNLKTEKFSHLAFWSDSGIRQFDKDQRVTFEIIENDSLKYSKTYDYDENGNTKRIDVAFMKGNEEAKTDTLFTKTTFFDLTMAKMNPDSGFGVDSVKTTGDESVIEKYKRFIGHWPDW